MGDLREAMLRRHSALQFLDNALLDLDHPITFRADEMMVVIRGMMPGKLVASHPVPKIEAVHETGFDQQLDGTIDCGQIAFPAGQGGVNLLVGQRMRMFPQHFKNRSSLTGDASRRTAKLFGQLRFGR